MRIPIRSITAGSAFMLAAAVLLAGCAGPRYATEVRYVPPTGEEGKSCIQGCQTEQKACQADCQSQRESCIANIQPTVDAAFDQALRQYESERQVYMRERKFYQLDRRLSFSAHRAPFFRSYPDPFWYIDHPYFEDPPVPPVAPGRAGIREQIINEECNADCGCQDTFDQCYVGCGGQVERRVVCVENCEGEAQESRPPEKPAETPGGGD
ncbi:hypothetical protein LV476_05030 [Guyparkeria hydrothermalis]|uniref:hypothetical protein n=1 Tax=Guyparkeria hydrothermalis TaxID=923 RepID=UPI00201FE062|nr:hypothetical protein [Guyparkeria hydrothermalis]MCL7744315.1 hypothetical protein [Guyparkeria hydrothermalis]